MEKGGLLLQAVVMQKLTSATMLRRRMSPADRVENCKIVGRCAALRNTVRNGLRVLPRRRRA